MAPSTPPPQEETGGKASTAIPPLPQDADQLTKWWKFADLLTVPIQILAPVVAWLVGGALGGWVFSRDIWRWIAAAFFLLLLAVAVLVRWRRSHSDRVAAAIDGVKATPILNSSERDYVAALLRRLHFGDRAWFCVSAISAFALVVVLLWRPALHMALKQVPREVPIATASYFRTSRDENLFRRAPFFEAVYSNLNQEGAPVGMKHKIVLVETQPLSHPTPPFALKFYVEEGRFDLAGFAFRLSSTNGREVYDPLPVSYQSGDAVKFQLPACEAGDRLLCIFRLSIKDADTFPSDLALIIHSAPEPSREEK